MTTAANEPIDALKVSRMRPVCTSWVMAAVAIGGLCFLVCEIAIGLASDGYSRPMRDMTTSSMLAVCCVAFAIGFAVMAAIALRDNRRPVGTGEHADLAAAASWDPLTAKAAAEALRLPGGIPIPVYNAIAADHEGRRIARIRKQSDERIARYAAAG